MIQLIYPSGLFSRPYFYISVKKKKKPGLKWYLSLEGGGQYPGFFSRRVGPKGPSLMRFHVIKKIFLYFCPFAVTCFTWPDAASDAWGTTFQLGCPSSTPYTNIPVASDTCLLAGIPGLLSKVGPKGPTLTRLHVIKKNKKIVLLL